MANKVTHMKASVANDLDFRVEKMENFNASTQKMIKRELKEIKEGKNLSPAFTNAKDAIDYLKSL